MRPLAQLFGVWIASMLPAVAATLVARPVAAQGTPTADKAAAEALFDDAKQLFLSKQYAEACPRFERSQRLDPGIGTLLFLADCYENLGRTSSAWATFREAAAAAKAAGQMDREQVARGRAALLQPKLFRLTLKVSTPDVPGLALKRNHTEVPKDVWSLPVPVDPGDYNIEVTAPGKRTWATSFQVPSTPGERAIAIPRLDDLPVRLPAAARPGSVALDPSALPPDPDAPQQRSRQLIAGTVISVVGLGGVVTGSVFGLLAVNNNNNVKVHCNAGKYCDEQGAGFLATARTDADVSTGAFIGGGAALVAGVILLATVPRAPTGSGPVRAAAAQAAPPRLWIAPMITGGLGGVVVGRSW